MHGPGVPTPCGNAVDLPGAFLITGKSAATVCVVDAKSAPAWIGSLDDFADDAWCTVLEPLADIGR